MKSSSKSPPAAAHADYIARDGKYEKRGVVELLEFGNMPEFARGDHRAFWVAADAHERANGRTYTELQIALPRELGETQRKELAREAAREFLGDRFAYTLAVHQPLAKDNIEQPHLHLMFSERAIDETTRALPEERFFKRNGAKKDPSWNDRNKPEEIRVKWCAMMNRKMAEMGIELQVDPRSWADQGREDLAELREPKTLGGKGDEARERLKEIAALRRFRQELPPAHLDGPAAVQKLEQEAEAQIAEIKRKRDEELGILDRLIAAAKKVLERAGGAVRQVLAPKPAPAKLAATREEHWLGLAGAERIKEHAQTVANRDEVADWLTKETAKARELRIAIRMQEARSWWSRDRWQLAADKDLLAKIYEVKPDRESFIASENAKIEAYEKKQREAFARYDARKKEAYGRERIALDLKTNHAELLLAAAYPNDARVQMERLAGGEKILIMGNRVVLAFREQRVYASLARRDQPEFEKHLAELMPKEVSRQPWRSRQPKSKDFERD